MGSSWIVGLCLGWGDLAAKDRLVLQHHFSMAPAGDAGHGEVWQVRIRSETATTAVQDVSLVLGADCQQRLVLIAAETDVADHVTSAKPWGR